MTEALAEGLGEVLFVAPADPDALADGLVEPAPVGLAVGSFSPPVQPVRASRDATPRATAYVIVVRGFIVRIPSVVRCATATRRCAAHRVLPPRVKKPADIATRERHRRVHDPLTCELLRQSSCHGVWRQTRNAPRSCPQAPAVCPPTLSRMGRGRAWLSLIAGVAVVAFAWWLLNRESQPTTPIAAASPSTSTARTAGAAVPAKAIAAQAYWTIDGDTMDISVAGKVERLRLLNIDAPERRSGAVPAECLSDEATGALIALAPRNTALRLVRHGKDRYGRTLGEAWLADGRMLGAEIARQGLAAPLVIGGAAPYRDAIMAARDEAAAARRGLHAATPACTVPSRAAALTPGDPAAATLLAELESAAPKVGVAALTAGHRASLIASVRARR